MSKGSHEVTESVSTRLCEWRGLNGRLVAVTLVAVTLVAVTLVAATLVACTLELIPDLRDRKSVV